MAPQKPSRDISEKVRELDRLCQEESRLMENLSECQKIIEEADANRHRALDTPTVQENLRRTILFETRQEKVRAEIEEIQKQIRIQKMLITEE